MVCYKKVLVVPVVIFCLCVANAKRRIEPRDDILQLRGQVENPTLLNLPSAKFLHNAIRQNSDRKWPKSKDGFVYVPYRIRFHDHYTKDEISVIERAMHTIQANTCVKFFKIPDYFPKFRNSAAVNYIQIENRPQEGCYSAVGRQSRGNLLALESNEHETCVEYDIVIHELLHSLGLWHEHMRHDRDDYVTVHKHNIKFGYLEQFRKIPEQESELYDTPYDYTSILHYPSDMFSANGQPTIQPKETSMRWRIGTATDASNWDLLKLCRIYQCQQCYVTATVSPIPQLSTQPAKLECKDNNDVCSFPHGQAAVDVLCRISVRLQKMCPKSCKMCDKFRRLYFQNEK